MGQSIVRRKRCTSSSPQQKEALPLESGGEHNDSLEGSLLWIRIWHAYAWRVTQEQGYNLSRCKEVWVCHCR